MNCPRCPTAKLDERLRDGIMIDHCGECRGVWLDRGELEKMLSKVSRERSAPDNADDDDEPGDGSAHRRRNVRADNDDDDDDDNRGRRGRGGWLDRLGGLFD